MAKVLHARLDRESEDALGRLARQLGWNESRIVREALKHYSVQKLVPTARRIIGLGKFNSGIKDLATNSKHLADFGKSSLK